MDEDLELASSEAVEAMNGLIALIDNQTVGLSATSAEIAPVIRVIWRNVLTFVCNHEPVKYAPLRVVDD